MPIKGMTDQLAAFPQIGTIRKGAAKDPKKNRPGADLTYFRVTFDEQEAEAANKFEETFGSEPREIQISLPFDDISRCWDAWRECYSVGALIHRCDGEYVDYAISRKTGEMLVLNGRLLVDTNGYKAGQCVPCTGKPVYHYKNKRTGEDVPVYCRPTGRLRVIIPALMRLAYLVVKTTSVHDVIGISEQLAAIQQLNDGQLRGIPLVLRRRPRLISTPSPDGKRVRREKWLISIEADPGWVRRKLEAMHRASLPALGPPVLALEDEIVEGELVGEERPEPEEQWPESEQEDYDEWAEPPEEQEEGEPEEPGPEEGEKPQARMTEGQFMQMVVKTITHYDKIRHARAVMSKLGLAWNPDEAVDLFRQLKEYGEKRDAEEADEAEETEEAPKEEPEAATAEKDEEQQALPL